MRDFAVVETMPPIPPNRKAFPTRTSDYAQRQVRGERRKFICAGCKVERHNLARGRAVPRLADSQTSGAVGRQRNSTALRRGTRRLCASILRLAALAPVAGRWFTKHAHIGYNTNKENVCCRSKSLRASPPTGFASRVSNAVSVKLRPQRIASTISRSANGSAP